MCLSHKTPLKSYSSTYLHLLLVHLTVLGSLCIPIQDIFTVWQV